MSAKIKNCPRPICVEHMIEMRCEKNDVTVNDREISGFQPSFWNGDRYECPHPDCTNSVVTGFGQPYAEGDLSGSKTFAYSYRAPECLKK